MTSSTAPRKTKIILNDYPYRRDIENRLLMAQLSVFEVHVLQEILHHSLRISVEQLADTLEISVKMLLPILDKLGSTKLFQRQNLTLIVDKEMRKYFEFQLEKFDKSFEPNLDFLQSVLNKVPIHVLPNWYSIPRASDNIFASIIEKFFLTPKIYLQHLEELQFEDSILESIMRDVYKAPDFTVKAIDLIAKYKLTRERFEEYLLLLEYHFVCCLSYIRTEDYWEEIVTPFAEWFEYLKFECKAIPVPIQDPVTPVYSTDFGFVKDLVAYLGACKSKKNSLKEVKHSDAQTHADRQAIVEKLLQLKFIQQNDKKQFIATEKGLHWLSKPISEQVSNLSVDPLNTLSNVSEFQSLWTIRNLHLIEKSLRRLKPYQWVNLDQFIKGFTAPIGEREPITLKNKGKKWRYVLPIYTDQEKRFIQAVILERLKELGIVNIGLHQNQFCFCLTSFGHQFV